MQETSQLRYRRFTRLVSGLALLLALLLVSGTALADDGETERGLIDARPTDTMVGTWTIDGKEYVTTDATEFDEGAGALAVDACAEVRYHEDNDADVVDTMRTLPADKCGHNGDDDSADSDNTDNDNAESESPDDRDGARAYGLVDSMPVGGTLGEWLIDDIMYIADEQTRFESDHGPFETDACVKVKYVVIDGENRALKLETEHAYRCGASGDDGTSDDAGDPNRVRGELYGELQAFPDELLGTWQIGGEEFEVTADTELKRDNGGFQLGMIVKVHFYEELEGDQAGTRFATEIESRLRGDDDDHGDDEHGNDDHGDRERDDNHGSRDRHRNAHAAGFAYGIIGTFPAGSMGPIGPWTIGDIAYTATDSTKFYQVEGLFEEGTCVLVRYWTDQDLQRIARLIKTDANGCNANTAEGKLFGFVDELPAPDANNNRNFVGQWNISGALLEADASTMFKESHGLLVQGAFVKAYYTTDGASNYLVSIETLVPPGAGDRIHRGHVERIDDGDVNAAAVANQVWVVDGQSFQVSDATDLDETDGLVTVGSLVEVNSYIAADGSEVATQIRTVAADGNTVFLPLLQK
ncbi:MAG: hypothetical protein KDE20_16475 [Caldilineaceae bacterium]|nr:hypothetical protein [Caldilineaceae bacterium]